MENQECTSCSPEANQPSSETERHPDTFQYGKDEEMILLQMAEVNDAPSTPGLKAAMEKSQYPNDTVGQQKSAPLFMERPKSSGIDVTAFCFAKPSGRNFSVKPSKPSKEPHTSREPVQSKPETPEEHDKQKRARNEACNSAFSLARPQSQQSPHSATDSLDVARTCSPAPPQIGKPEKSNQQAISGGEDDDLNGHPDKAQAQDEEAAGPLSTTNIHSQDPETDIVGPQNKDPGDIRHGDNTRESTLRTNTPMMTNEPGSVPLKDTPKDSFRVSKRCRARSRRSACRKPSMPRPVDDEDSQLTEDDLFQILITRIRQREEDAIAAANLRKQLEATASQLAEENEALRAELETYGAQLQKKTLDSRTYKAQMNSWKTKLGKFKHFLNALGTDYQTLRGESINLKATRSALDKEGKELRSNIDDIKAQISKVTTSVSERKNHILESETIISALRNDLKLSDEKTRLIQSQLLVERKRVMTLESYIQSHSLAQEKQLGLIRADHLGINQKIDSALQTMAKLWESSQTTIRSSMGPTMDKCLSAIDALSEKESMDSAEIQKFANLVHGFISRMDVVVPQLTKEFEKNSDTNDSMRAFLKEQLQNIENHFAPDCDLYKHLSTSKEACRSLYEKIDILGPNVCTLNATIQRIDEKENGLVEEIKELGRSLTETRDLAKKSPTVPEDDIIPATAEIVSQLEKISEELRIAQETIQEKNTENEHTKQSLLEANEALQEAETKAALYEAEVGSLQRQAQAIENRIREELNRASVIARDQNRAKFEQQLHGILKEKEAVEKDLQKTKELLAIAQQSQNDALTEQHQKEMESLLLVKEQEIETLRNKSEENVFKFATQETELKRLGEIESTYTTQQKSLQQEINEANQKIATLEAEIALKKVDQLSLQELEKKLDELQAELSRKEEERLSIQEKLTAADTARLALESGKAKAKGEIHALLLRVQDSERWMKAIKESLEKFGICTSTESFPDTCRKLEALLQSAIASGFPNPASNVSLQQVSCTPGIISTPRKGCENPAPEFFQTTEVIYRTHNIPRSAYASPAGRDPFQPGGANTTIESVPESQMSASIVPFSSFQKQLSPAHCSSPNQDAEDFANILTQISQKEHPAKESNNPVDGDRNDRSSSSTTEKDANSVTPRKRTDGNSRTNNSKPKMSEIRTPATGSKFKDSLNRTRDADSIHDKHKAVTFEDQKIANTGSKRRTPDSLHREIAGGSSKGFERRPARQNKRTYSRLRQTSPVREQGGPSTDDTFADGELPYNGNKRARVSTGSNYSRSHRQTQGTAEPVDRRPSPASLASGSSRQNTANEDPSNKQWAGRGQKRPGRKTRGERYSARFNQESGAR